MKALKKGLVNKCGVYRWYHKETHKTYVGGAKDLGDRPFRHAGMNSTNKELQALKRLHGNNRFYLIILWIAGVSADVHKYNVYNVEMDYFLRRVPKHLWINKDSVLDGEFTTRPFTRERKQNISKRMLGKKRSNDAKAANRASAISAIGVQLSRYLTKRELRHPKIVTGNVNEVKNFNSLRARRYWSGYAARADRITSVLNKRPPLIKNKHNGYTYFIKLLTPKEKNVLQLEPWGAKPSIHNLYNFFCSCHY